MRRKRRCVGFEGWKMIRERDIEFTNIYNFLAVMGGGKNACASEG